MRNKNMRWHPPVGRQDTATHFKKKRGSVSLWWIILLPLVSGADTLKPTDLQSGGLLLAMQAGYQVATTLNTDVDITVNGLVARVKVRQEFQNTGSDWAEGVYVFPLPERAAGALRDR